ncbi:hypothetical protein D3C77_549860 [compost metagenome]
MSYFAGEIGNTAVQLSADDHAGTNPDPNAEINEISSIASCSVEPLTDRPRVSFIINMNMLPEFCSKLIMQGDIVPAQIRSGDNSAFLID